MACARTVKRVFSPLDEELGLLPGGLTPSLQEDIVRLGTWMPFRRVVGELHHFRHTDVAKSTVERLTESAGAAYVAVQTSAVEQIERELPVPPPGPAQQFLSVDGAMVPLVGGEWAEVRTLVIGDVLPPQLVKGEQVVRTANHTYFSRMVDANTFERLALVETQCRGVETAQAVAAVTDGAEWIQKFVDHHRYDAVRILDFPHAAEHVGAFAQVLWDAKGEEKANWLHQQLHQLKTEGITPVLITLRQEASQQAERAELTSALAYLEKRAAHMQYPAFQEAGWPIGDGAVESANKLVVEARLKGSGMHWARPHVDPMLALRNIACSDRWAEVWPQITATLRQQAQQRTTQRRLQRQSLTAKPAAPAPTLTPATTTQTHRSPLSTLVPLLPPFTQPPAAPAPRQPWRPPADHPWRRMPIGRARFTPSTLSPTAKH
jgi:hypothetical protein